MSTVCVYIGCIYICWWCCLCCWWCYCCCRFIVAAFITKPVVETCIHTPPNASEIQDENHSASNLNNNNSNNNMNIINSAFLHEEHSHQKQLTRYRIRSSISFYIHALHMCMLMLTHYVLIFTSTRIWIYFNLEIFTNFKTIETTTKLDKFCFMHFGWWRFSQQRNQMK